MCVTEDSSVVDSSLAGDLTAKPLTVSLIFCPILSCRVSGMSLICFFTWHASSSCIIRLLARGFQDNFALNAHRPLLLHACITVGLMSAMGHECSDFKFLEYEKQTFTARELKQSTINAVYNHCLMPCSVCCFSVLWLKLNSVCSWCSSF